MSPTVPSNLASTLTEPVFELRIGALHVSIQHVPQALPLGIFTVINALLSQAGTGWFKHL